MNSKTKIRDKVLQRLRDERGWTLIELLIGTTMMLTVFFAALPIIDGAANTEGRIQTAATSVGDARNFSDQILRDLRPAYQVVGAYTPTNLTIDTWVRSTSCGSGTLRTSDLPAIQCMVTYSCSGDSCTRQERNPDGSGGGPVVNAVSGLSDDNVFSYIVPGDTPVYVGIALVLPNQNGVGGDAITLQDGTALRNVGAT